MILSTPDSRHPVVIVTGANSGVGFGICHRLLVQLSRSFTDDTLPRKSYQERPIPQLSQPSPFAPVKQLTLVLACRGAERAAAARQRLFNLMDEEVLRQESKCLPGGCAKELRKGLRIDSIPLDLTSMESIFDFAGEANRRYSYVTHLILNAGILCIAGLDWLIVFKQLLTEPVVAVTTPRFLRQSINVDTPDGLGLVWQSNVFGHYSLFRLLEPLLRQNPYLDSRVEWMSSLDALPEDYEPADPQLRRTKFSYQASKYQVDLICTMLARAESQRSPSSKLVYIHHLLVQPGVCSTNMASSHVSSLMEMLKFLLFYLVRFLGSKNHPIYPYQGAVAALHAALAPSALLQTMFADPPLKYGSRSSPWGREYVGIDPVLDWEENMENGRSLLTLCEKIFTMFAQRRGESTTGDTDTEIVRS